MISIERKREAAVDILGGIAPTAAPLPAQAIPSSRLYQSPPNTPPPPLQPTIAEQLPVFPLSNSFSSVCMTEILTYLTEDLC